MVNERAVKPAGQWTVVHLWSTCGPPVQRTEENINGSDVAAATCFFKKLRCSQAANGVVAKG